MPRGRQRGTGVPHGAVQGGCTAPRGQGRPARPGGSASHRGPQAAVGRRRGGVSVPACASPPAAVLSQARKEDRARLKAEEVRRSRPGADLPEI